MDGDGGYGGEALTDLGDPEGEGGGATEEGKGGGEGEEGAVREGGVDEIADGGEIPKDGSARGGGGGGGGEGEKETTPMAPEGSAAEDESVERKTSKKSPASSPSDNVSTD